MLTISNKPSNGNALVLGTTISYTPNSGYEGTDSISYTINDGNGGTATATISITVTKVNNSPTAQNVSVSFPENTTNNTIGLATQISDADGDNLTVTISNDPNNGNATVSSTTINYTPNVNYEGTDSISYTINDGNRGTATATISITVTSVTPTAVFSNGTGQGSSGTLIISNGPIYFRISASSGERNFSSRTLTIDDQSHTVRGRRLSTTTICRGPFIPGTYT